MPSHAVIRALRKAGLKREAEQRIVENKHLAKLIVEFIILVSSTLETKIENGGYHGKADLSQLPKAVKKVRRQFGFVRDYDVAEKMGLKPKTFSRILSQHPEIRIEYENLRSSHTTG